MPVCGHPCACRRVCARLASWSKAEPREASSLRGKQGQDLSWGGPAPGKSSAALGGTILHVAKLMLRESGVCPKLLGGRARFSLASHREKVLQGPPIGPSQGPAILVVHPIAMVGQLSQVLRAPLGLGAFKRVPHGTAGGRPRRGAAGGPHPPTPALIDSSGSADICWPRIPSP